MAKKSFEDALEKLDKIVESLENDELTLEACVKKYEEGIKLSKFCREKLDEAEQKIKILKKDISGEIHEENFNE